MTELIILGIFLFWVIGMLCYAYEPSEKQKQRNEEYFKRVRDSLIADTIWKKSNKDKSFFAKFF